jgi:hypothetical protein
VTLSVEDICTPGRLSPEESVRTARLLSDERRSFEIEVFRFLSQQLSLAGVDAGIIERTLEVLIAVAPLTRLHGALRSALSHVDFEVRSKAAVAVAHCVADDPLLQRLLSDNDARVRANTLEALWDMRAPGIEEAFVRALSDTHHRTVANAIYGLYLIDPEKYLPRACSLIDHPHPSYRASGAWLLGKIGDAANISRLRPLLTERNAAVRTAAFAALSVLRATERPALHPSPGYIAEV